MTLAIRLGIRVYIPHSIYPTNDKNTLDFFSLTAAAFFFFHETRTVIIGFAGGQGGRRSPAHVRLTLMTAFLWRRMEVILNAKT